MKETEYMLAAENRSSGQIQGHRASTQRALGARWERPYVLCCMQQFQAAEDVNAAGQTGLLQTCGEELLTVYSQWRSAKQTLLPLLQEEKLCKDLQVGPTPSPKLSREAAAPDGMHHWQWSSSQR